MALTFLFAAAPVVAPPVQDADEIVVLARKLQTVQLKMALSRKQGIFRAKSCAIKQSTGDAEIDPIPCGAAQLCSTLNLTTQDAFVACVKTRGREAIAALAARRREARDAQ
jgi:hypothetical protein